jgi:RNA-splicing ligase RtcB
MKHTGIDVRAKMKVYNEEWVASFLSKIKSNMGEVERALGTLGGGNHFIEFDRSEKTGEEYITVHSGSRIIGKKICEYHQRKIAQQNEVDWSYFDAEVEKFNKKNKNKQERKEFRDQLRSEIKTKDKKNYLEGDDVLEYYRDLIWGQMFALVNREVMLTKILEKLDLPFDPILKIESIHNYIDFDDQIMRKGAISAHHGNECIIALNMTDGILLCEGKGNQDWNYSCAHGAGRQITRQKAQKNSQAIARRLAKELAKYEIMTVNPLTEIADEAPECYKDSEFIKLRIEDTVVIKEQLKPFINIKHTS